MIQIDWEEYKKFKTDFANTKHLDNFGVLLYFLKAYYNIRHVTQMFEVLQYDELSKMMLEKRELKNEQDLERYVKRMTAS